MAVYPDRYFAGRTARLGAGTFQDDDGGIHYRYSRHRGGRGLNAEAVEPYLQLVSAVIVAGVALWMIWRTRRDRQLEKAGHHHDGEEVRKIDTGHGTMALEVFDDGLPPRWRIRFESGHGWAAKDVAVTTERPDKTRQAFSFTDRGDDLESVEAIPTICTRKLTACM
jgi:nickel/cobalt exporter